MTAFDLAQRMVGEIRELPGAQQHPFIQWSHMLCNLGPEQPDTVPWCSSFANAICWLLRLPRSKSAAARSWLGVGEAIDLRDARPGFDVVILKRGSSPTAGHVGFYAGRNLRGDVEILGGNQGDAVSVAPFKEVDVLGVRRLA